MGTLATSMSRLRAEIDSATDERRTFLATLQTEVADLRNTNLTELADSSRRARAERRGFVEQLSHETSAMRARFKSDLQSSAAAERAARQGFLSQLRDDVGQMRDAFQTDLSDARRSYWAPSEVSAPRPLQSSLPTLPVTPPVSATATPSLQIEQVSQDRTSAPAPHNTSGDTNVAKACEAAELALSKAREEVLAWSKMFEAEHSYKKSA